jgi:hypothetical protein
MDSDGVSLDDERDKIGDGPGELPDIRKQWFARDKAKKNDRKAKHFFVPVQEIEGNKFDPPIGRYRETKYEETQFETPLERIADPAFHDTSGIFTDMAAMVYIDYCHTTEPANARIASAMAGNVIEALRCMDRAAMR